MNLESTLSHNVSLYEGEIKKKAEGVFDFNWNERFLVLLTDRLFYFQSRDELETKKTIMYNEVRIASGMCFNPPKSTLILHFTKEPRITYF